MGCAAPGTMRARRQMATPPGIAEIFGKGTQRSEGRCLERSRPRGHQLEAYRLMWEEVR